MNEFTILFTQRTRRPDEKQSRKNINQPRDVRNINQFQEWKMFACDVLDTFNYLFACEKARYLTIKQPIASYHFSSVRKYVITEANDCDRFDG